MINLNEKIPSSLEEAVDLICSKLDKEEIEFIKGEEPTAAHFFFGMSMRNAWGLWHDSVLAKYFKQVWGLGHADDMSGMILSALFAKIKGEKFLAKEESQRYKDYWKNMNIDPLTQEKIK